MSSIWERLFTNLCRTILRYNLFPRFENTFRYATIVLAVTCAIVAKADEVPRDKRPNVVFFLVDDLGAMDIGAYNASSFYETPNIDRLARSGMQFMQGYAASCVCSPTRFSIMTGKYPARNKCTDWLRTFFSTMTLKIPSGAPRKKPLVRRSTFPSEPVRPPMDQRYPGIVERKVTVAFCNGISACVKTKRQGCNGGMPSGLARSCRHPE